DIERHHRALREPHQSRIALVEAPLLQFLVDKAVEQRRRRAYPGQHGLRGAVLHAEPLIAIGRHIARERRVRRDELGIRHEPTPTGFLHLGHVRSVLEGWRAAREAGGRFLLRIEDIDHTRCRSEYTGAIIEDLGWLGLDWDGPVRRQSEHFDDYRAALAKLEVA